MHPRNKGERSTCSLLNVCVGVGQGELDGEESTEGGEAEAKTMIDREEESVLWAVSLASTPPRPHPTPTTTTVNIQMLLGERRLKDKVRSYFTLTFIVCSVYP